MAPKKTIEIREADSYKEGEKQDFSDYAWLSKSAYEMGNNKSHIPTGYEVDRELSNRNRTVFYHKEKNEAVIAYRGTNPKKLGDLGTDLAIAVGAQATTARFKNAEKVADQAVTKYGKENVVVTGHSLGGSQALHVAAKKDLKAYAFNPGKGFDGKRYAQIGADVGKAVVNAKQQIDQEFDPFKKVAALTAPRKRKAAGPAPPKKKAKESKATIYTTGTDPISAATVLNTEKRKVVRAKSKNPLKAHDIDNFT